MLDLPQRITVTFENTSNTHAHMTHMNSYEFDLEFEIPATFPVTNPEIW
jgi:hypothetical protein